MKNEKEFNARTMKIADSRDFFVAWRKNWGDHIPGISGKPRKGLSYNKMQNGYVYLMVDDSRNMVKVGSTRDLKARHKTLSWVYGENLKVYGFVIAKYHNYLEKFIHVHFAQDAITREWYVFSDDFLKRFLDFLEKHGEVFEAQRFETL